MRKQQQATDTPPANIMDRVKSYQDACGILGVTPLTIENFGFLPEAQRLSAFGHHKVQTIATVLNEGHEFDWNSYDREHWKWYPYFDMETYEGAPAGSGFSFYGCVYGYAGTILGSRLAYKTEDLARYAGTQFLDDYRDWIKG
jgi:hypothetical protein